ncbi:hypothetical protein YC2023_066124 [Brassica napus]
MCVRVCPSAHTGRPWLSISTHISTLVLRLSMLALPVDCLGDFGPRGLSVQYTQDVCGCPPAHTGRPWVSASTHRTSVAVCGCPSAHTGRPTHISTLVLGLSMLTLPVDCSSDFGPRRLSIQYTQDVRGCPSAHTRRPTLVLGLSTLTLPVDCSGDFSRRGLSGQYTQDVCGCLPAHTGRPWLSVCVSVCLSVSVCTHKTSVAVHQYTYQHVGPWTQHAGPSRDCLGNFSTRGLSVQYTQDIRGCLQVRTGHLWLSVAVRQHTQDVHSCSSAHRGRSWLSVCVCGCPPAYTRTFVAVCGCLSAHTRHLSVSVSTHRTSIAVRQHTEDVRGCLCVSVCVCGCPPAYTRTFVAICGCLSVYTRRLCVSVSTHRTSVCVRVCPSAHTGHPWLSISTHINTVALPVDCSGYFGPRGLCVQFTQDVRGCPSAHTRRPKVSIRTQRTSMAVRLCPCVSVSTHRTSVAVHHTHRTSMGVRQHTQDVRVCPSAHTGCPGLSVCVRQHTQDVRDCNYGPRGLSDQYTQDVRGCPPAHTGPPWLSVTFVVVNQYTYPHVGPWTQHVDPSRGLFGTSVAVRVCQCVYVCVRQHTQDVRGCPSVHISARCTHRTSVGVRQHTQDICGCLWLSVSTHRTSVAVRQHTQDVRGCPCVSVCVCRCPPAYTRTFVAAVAVHQHIQDVRVCPSAHTGHPCVSVCVRQHTQDVCGCPSVHILACWPFPWTVRVILAHVGCVFSTHRTSVGVRHTHMTSVGVRQHTEDVYGCPCMSVSVRVCPSAHTGRLWLSISTHISTMVLGLSMLALPVDCLGDFGPRGLSVHYTQGVRGCPPAHIGRLWLSVAVRQHTQDVCGCPTLTLPVECLGDFGPRQLSIQFTQDVRGCPSGQTRRPSVSINTHRTSGAVRVCLCVSVSTQNVCGCPSVHISERCTRRTSVGVCQHTQDVRGCPCVLVCYTEDICRCLPAHTGHLWLSVAVRQHTQDVSSCPSAHTRRPWLSVCVCVCLWVSASIDKYVRGCLWLSVSTYKTSVCVRQHTQDVRVCPCVSVNTHRTSVAVHQYTYQHAGPWTQHTGPSRGLFG